MRPSRQPKALLLAHIMLGRTWLQAVAQQLRLDDVVKNKVIHLHTSHTYTQQELQLIPTIRARAAIKRSQIHISWSWQIQSWAE